MDLRKSCVTSCLHESLDEACADFLLAHDFCIEVAFLDAVGVDDEDVVDAECCHGGPKSAHNARTRKSKEDIDAWSVRQLSSFSKIKLYSTIIEEMDPGCIMQRTIDDSSTDVISVFQLQDVSHVPVPNIVLWEGDAVVVGEFITRKQHPIKRNCTACSPSPSLKMSTDGIRYFTE